MSDNISILTSTTNKYLTKTFSGSEFAEQRFSIDKQFSLSQEPVGDLQNLSKLLQRLENDPTQTIIRGSLIEDQTNPVSRNKETFTAIPRQWAPRLSANRYSNSHLQGRGKAQDHPPTPVPA